MIRLIATLLLLPFISFGQLFTRTNDILYLQPTDYPINGQLNTPIQYTVKVKINNTDFTMATGSVRWLIYDGLSGAELAGYDGTYTGSIASVNYTPTFLVNGYAKLNFYRPSGELQAMISWNNYSITNPCVTCGGGGGATSVTVTNLINSTNTVALNITNTASVTVTNLINSTNTASVTVTNLNTSSVTVTNLINSTNVNSTSVTVTNLISSTNINSSSVVVTNLITSTNIISVVVTNVGGGGGSGTLSGFNSATTGGVFLVVSNGWDASITNEGNVFTINTGLPRGATGVNQVATWNGTNWIATALGAPTPTPTVGTNKILWTTVWGVTNTWVAPSTQIMFTAWGAGGGNAASGAGHARALWVGSAGTIFDIVIGTAGGGAIATNNGPFSGSGINGGATNVSNGGGATYIAISGTTNIILIAGGSGGGSSGATGFGGPGGGFWFSTLDGGLGTGATNVSAGQGASASNEYGLAATAGTNVAVTTTNTMQNGGFLRGGHASTNGCTAGITPSLGGGGGGWYGGAGATRTNVTVGGTIGAGGGGGSSYADTNYVIFAQLYAGERAVAGSPAGQDHPTYTSGRGVGGLNAGGAGVNGCAGAMW